MPRSCNHSLERSPNADPPWSAWQRRRRLQHVLPDGARRQPKAELQQQLVRDPFLAPRWVLACHSSNQTLQLDKDWPPTSCGLSAPQEAEALTVPIDQRPGPHNNQSVSPIKPAAEQHQGQAGRIVGTSGLALAFLRESELLAQKQIFGSERSPGA
jgi:hypothetical protein